MEKFHEQTAALSRKTPVVIGTPGVTRHFCMTMELQ
jgi:hypothetical protein